MVLYYARVSSAVDDAFCCETFIMQREQWWIDERWSGLRRNKGDTLGEEWTKEKTGRDHRRKDKNMSDGSRNRKGDRKGLAKRKRRRSVASGREDGSGQ